MALRVGRRRRGAIAGPGERDACSRRGLPRDDHRGLIHRPARGRRHRRVEAERDRQRPDPGRCPQVQPRQTQVAGPDPTVVVDVGRGQVTRLAPPLTLQCTDRGEVLPTDLEVAAGVADQRNRDAIGFPRTTRRADVQRYVPAPSSTRL